MIIYNKGDNMDKKPGIEGFIGRKMYGKKKMANLSKKSKKDDEMDNGKHETKMHERMESKKKEESED